MMKWIMTALAALSVIFAAATGNMERVSAAFLEECENAVQLTISLIGIIALWSGIMRVVQSAGFTELLSRLFSPLLSPLFRGLKRGGKAMQLISLNITANLLGLGNASTPFGLAAMQEIEREEHSSRPEYASKNMIIFTVMNTASLQIIPTTVAALRLKNGSAAPMEILPCVWITSAAALAAALIAVHILGRKDRKKL